MQISSSSEAESELEIESDLKVNLTKNSAPTESRPKRLKLKSFIRPKETSNQQDSTEKARLSVGDVFEMEGQSSAKKSHLKKPQVLLAFFLGSFSPNSYVVSE